VVDVRDGALTLPFADAMLARTLAVTGMPTPAALDCAREVGLRLGRADRVVDVQQVRETTAVVLASRGEGEVLRRLRVRWWLRARHQPLVLAIGGTSGVGKSTVSHAVAQVLGIGRVLSTDLVRAVLRGTLHPELIPALSESSFSAQRMLRSNLEGDPLLVAFEQQSSIVLQASLSLVRRALKEGLQLVVNGVHIVPGLVDVPPEWPLVMCVLTVPDISEHERRFSARFATSDRNPEHYLSRLQAIRDLDGYIVQHCRRRGVPVIESRDTSQTVSDVVGAIAADLEARFDLSMPHADG
jgi:2-phosphoglycerate kinase